jgi:hypothetical protein
LEQFPPFNNKRSEQTQSVLSNVNEKRINDVNDEDSEDQEEDEEIQEFLTKRQSSQQQQQQQRESKRTKQRSLVRPTSSFTTLSSTRLPITNISESESMEFSSFSRSEPISNAKLTLLKKMTEYTRVLEYTSDFEQQRRMCELIGATASALDKLSKVK